MKKIIKAIPGNPVQLYSCSATVSKKGLVSYRTRIVTISDKAIKMHLVHTSTTMMHTRKYIKLLRDCGEKSTANIVEILYRLCIKHKAQDAVYNVEDGNISVTV